MKLSFPTKSRVIICFTLVTVISALFFTLNNSASANPPVGGVVEVAAIEDSFIELSFVPSDKKNPSHTYIVPYMEIKQVRVSEDQHNYRLSIYFTSVTSESDRNKPIIKIQHKLAISSHEIAGRIDGDIYEERKAEIDLFLKKYKAWLNR